MQSFYDNVIFHRFLKMSVCSMIYSYKRSNHYE